MAIIERVVSSFQILYLWHQKQQQKIKILWESSCEFLSNLVSLTSETTKHCIKSSWNCCEFLSNLVSLTSETTFRPHISTHVMLWVPFKSCIFDIRNNHLVRHEGDQRVVSSFQILYLWHQKQQIFNIRPLVKSCEFLSNLVSLTSETTNVMRNTNTVSLWVPFKSCIFDIRNNGDWKWIY